MTDCTYCGSNLTPYDPVFVTRGHDAESDERPGGEREGAFCNYGCLSAWLEETDAATGACCRIDV